MSVVSLGKHAPTLPHDEVATLASTAGITISDKHVDDFAKLLGAFEQTVDGLLAEEDYVPNVDLDKYPRTDIHVPNDTDKGGWATKCTAKCVEPKNDLLKGKTVALKDNVALAGVRCTNGTTALDWTPQIDATIVTRILDAGATITGKATCENACLEGVSDTSCTGKVHNPYAHNYSCGGSSSGSGRLVATASVDMAIGCDQGGSIRIPSSMCGLVGLKPTWGLVSQKRKALPWKWPSVSKPTSFPTIRAKQAYINLVLTFSLSRYRTRASSASSAPSTIPGLWRRQFPIQHCFFKQLPDQMASTIDNHHISRQAHWNTTRS